MKYLTIAFLLIWTSNAWALSPSEVEREVYKVNHKNENGWTCVSRAVLGSQIAKRSGFHVALLRKKVSDSVGHMSLLVKKNGHVTEILK